MCLIWRALSQQIFKHKGYLGWGVNMGRRYLEYWQYIPPCDADCKLLQSCSNLSPTAVRGLVPLLSKTGVLNNSCQFLWHMSRISAIRYNTASAGPNFWPKTIKYEASGWKIPLSNFDNRQDCVEIVLAGKFRVSGPAFRKWTWYPLLSYLALWRQHRR